MTVKTLYRYPVKSLGGSSVDQLQPDARGFRDDRRWMFVDARGRFISQRSNVGLSEYAARITGGDLTFTHLPSGEIVGLIKCAKVAASKVEVTVWDDTFTASRIESEVLYELTRALGIPDARLVYMAPEDVRPVDPKYARPDETVSFADGYPYLVTTTGSLAFLANELGDPALDERRFRPNIVIHTQQPWLEDTWTALRIGDHKFRLPKPCARCVMITHQPGTRDRDLSVLAELAKHRKVDSKVLFGMNALWEGGHGKLSIGDQVVVV